MPVQKKKDIMQQMSIFIEYTTNLILKNDFFIIDVELKKYATITLPFLPNWH